MRVIAYFTAIILFWSIGNANAQEQQNAAAPQGTAQPQTSDMLVITPLDGCLAKLDKADADDIRRNYSKPYGECLKRLRVKETKDNSIGVTKAQAPVPEKNAEATVEEKKPEKKWEFKITPRSSAMNE